MKQLILGILAISVFLLAGCTNTAIDQKDLSGDSKTEKIDEVTPFKNGQGPDGRNFAGENLSTIARQWNNSVTKNKQLPPQADINQASASYADVLQHFSTNPTFEQIVELSKDLEFYRLETTGAKYRDTDPIRLEYWGTLGADTRKHGTVRITYCYGFPSVVDLYHTYGSDDAQEPKPSPLLFYSYGDAVKMIEAGKTGG